MTSDIKSNFWKLFDYFCVIERSAIGVCCPDDITERNGQLVVSLPASGSDHVKPWEVQDEENDHAEESADDQERGCGVSTKQFPKIAGGRPADPGEYPWMAGKWFLIQSINLFPDFPLSVDHEKRCDRCFLRGSSNNRSSRLVGRALLQPHQDSRPLRPPRRVFVRDGERNKNARLPSRRDSSARRLRRLNIRERHCNSEASSAVAFQLVHFADLLASSLGQLRGKACSRHRVGNAVLRWSAFADANGSFSSHLAKRRLSRKVRAQDSWLGCLCGSWQGWLMSRRQRVSSRLQPAIKDRIIVGFFYSGPLMIQLPNKRWTVIGIVSWGVRCGEKDHPGIYTKVESYIQWIIENATF